METTNQEMLQAARAVLDHGWYLFACVYRDKKPFKGSHGSRDALNRDNDIRALTRWTHPLNLLEPANPAIALNKSGLVGVDVDYGFQGLTDDEVLKKAEAAGLPATYTVRSGGDKGGAHFIYSGTRTLPDVTGWNHDGLSGDIKHNGYVIAAGGLHKSGNQYRVINDIPPAPLPNLWRDFAKPKKPKLTPETVAKLSPFELDDLKRDGSKLSSEEWGFVLDIYPEMAKAQKTLLRSKDRETVAADTLVPIKHRQQWLTKQIGRLKAMSMSLAVIRLCIDHLATMKCEDGLRYMQDRQKYWDAQVFGWGKSMPDGEIDFPKRGLVIRKKSTREEVLAGIIRTFPDGITSSEALDLLAQRLAERDVTFNKKSHRKLAERARKLAGVTVVGRRWHQSVPMTYGTSEPSGQQKAIMHVTDNVTSHRASGVGRSARYERPLVTPLNEQKADGCG
jgi:hypothetical protein